MTLVLQALINGLVSGTLLAVPAIGFTAMFAVLRFPNFAVSGLATLGAFAGYLVYGAAGSLVAALVVAFAVAGAVGLRPHRRAVVQADGPRVVEPAHAAQRAAPRLTARQGGRPAHRLRVQLRVVLRHNTSNGRFD